MNFDPIPLSEVKTCRNCVHQKKKFTQEESHMMAVDINAKRFGKPDPKEIERDEKFFNELWFCTLHQSNVELVDWCRSFERKQQ